MSVSSLVTEESLYVVVEGVDVSNVVWKMKVKVGPNVLGYGCLGILPYQRSKVKNQRSRVKNSYISLLLLFGEKD